MEKTSQFFHHAMLALMMLIAALSANAANIIEVDSILYTLNGNEATVVQYDRESTLGYYRGDVVIPAHFTYQDESYTVTAIGDYAFAHCRLMYSVSMPNTIKSIGEHAFASCGVLERIQVPEGVTTIGEDAFAYCDYLTEIYFPSTVTQIGEGALQECMRLEAIVVENGNPVYDSRQYCNALIESATGTLLVGCGNTIIPDGVQVIADRAFYNCKPLKKIIFPESVTHIGSEAFASCINLARVTIVGNGLKTIGKSAFEDCSRIESVHITDLAAWCGIQHADFASNPLVHAHHLYLNGREVTDLVVPDGVTAIGSYAFNGCYGLTSITLPSSVTTIGEGAFMSCDSITSVVLHDGITVIEKNLFSSCYSLTQVTLPSTITSIGKGAFDFCTKLTSINIPESVTSIGESAFWNCTSLPQITLPNSLKTIDKYAFEDCEALQRIIIGNGVEYIGMNAFDGCKSLTEVHAPDLYSWCRIHFTNEYANPTSYAHHLYINGEVLSHLEIPDGITAINTAAFVHCDDLAGVVIPEGVTRIGTAAFKRCSNLSSVNMSGSINTVDGDAFASCSGLNKVVTANLSAWCRTQFASGTANPLAYAHHLFTAQGEEVIDLIVPDDVEQIGKYAFYHHTQLQSMKTGKGVKTIGGNAFNGCTALQELHLGGQLESIGDYAFTGCTGITSAIIPDSVTCLGSDAFKNCTGLKTVHTGNGITFLSGFENCTSLENLTIGENVTEIGIRAFNNCTSLRTLTIPNSTKVIWGGAFDYCSSLKVVSLGTGITYMGTCFSRCNNIKHVINNSTTPVSTSSDVFYCYDSATLYVPKQSLNSYKTAKYWKKFHRICGFNTLERLDVNCDGEVTIADVNRVIDDIIDGVEEAPLVDDVNLDGEVTVADVNTILGRITHH